MESPITMGEAGDNICKDKTEHTDDGVCVNGNLDCGEPMEVCEKDSKAPEVNSNKIDSLKNCEKVPENKVPTTSLESDDDEPMDVDDTLEEENGTPKSDLDDDEKEIEDVDDAEKEIEDLDDDDEKEVEDKINDETTDKLDDVDSEAESVKSSGSKVEKNVETNVVNGTSSDNSVNGTTEDADVSIVKSQKDKNTKKSNSVDLNDSGDVVLVENDSEHKENGDVCSSPDVEEVISVSDKDTANSSAEVINLVSPAKKKKKPTTTERISDPPRRSSRNLNKQKSYVEKEEDPEVEDPDVEEVTPEDPLADPLRDDKENSKKIVTKQPAPQQTSSTIVVSDTKRLVEIAANSKSSNSSGKKEPTLVIIDTNSILSGRGPVPVSHKPSPLPASFSMMPVALPAQGVYPPNMRATITPIPMSGTTSKSVTVTPSAITTVASPTPAPILPTLTDDMYVVEAPSFIVPYVYEKPPIKPFRDFVSQIQKDIEEQKKLEAEKKKEMKEKSDGEPKKSDDEDEEDEEDDSDIDEKKNDEGDKSKSKIDSKEDVHEEKNSEDSEKKDAKSKDSEETDKKDDKKDEVVIVSSKDENLKTIDLDDIPDDSSKPKSSSYFDNALGQFFINIGYGLVQEFVQTDLLKQQKRKQNREGTAPETKMAITSLIKNLEYSKENNEPYKLEQRRCEFCSFKTESTLVLSHHLETPHMRNYVYKCNFCTMEVRSPHDILFHMEAEHNTRGRLERAPAFHQCPNCPFEDNQKGKLSRHLVTCVKKFKPERNLEPPIDWEPPAKIPRVPRVKQQGLSATAATYQALAQAKGNYQLFSKLQQAASPQNFPRGRGRPSLMGKVNSIRPQTPLIRTANMMYRPGTAGGSVLVPTTYQFGGNQIFQVVGGQSELGVGGRLSVSGPGAPTSAPVALVPNLASTQSTVTIQNSSGTKSSSGKVVQQPSISITPLPRQPATSSTTITKTSGSSSSGSAAGDPSSSKATFVICEICDGYIKDLEQLRNHMQWIHKVKIHPKMIYNRPPLNCQKCQFRFFTDQGLERHLLGSHGLVTSSMQEAANKSKDAGRCPVCGRVYQWKLLNHVARDHNMTLKPAHLSYKCTVCTATFGMYKQFENHVYSAHSVVAKRVMEKKSSPSSSGASPSSSGATVTAATISARTGDSLLKPLKINDEITIIPQPAKASKSSAGGITATRASVTTGK